MIYFATSVFISAFLLFQIQPLIGKFLLPWFGGTPAVWSTVLLFFQTLLIAGYAYTYWLVGHISPRKQRIIHLSVLLIACVCMLTLSLLWPSPITPDASWKPHSVDFPIGHIFILLTISVGLPYFILATNAPLMQAWFSHRYPLHSPYRLYSLSNVGALLALLTYPFLIEPLFSIHAQENIWSVLFLGFVLVVAYITLRQPLQKYTSTNIMPPATPTFGVQSIWLALSACASIMLMAVTNQITQEIAAIPFLWVLPLLIYLLSFILTFSSTRWYSRPLFSFLLLIASMQYMWIFTSGPAIALIPSIVGYSFLLFVCCMICNGELFRLKPHTAYLTRFYLMLALGGMIGGMSVNFVAPLFFTGYWELECGVLLCCLLLLILVFAHPAPVKKNYFVSYVGCICITAILLSALTARMVLYTQTHALFALRNFYGVLHVKEAHKGDPQKHFYILTHGATIHGLAFASAQKRDIPILYYLQESGIGLAILHHPQRGKGMRVGILGLGTGTLAIYGQAGDTYRFYEINPAMISIATAKEYFHFIEDSKAQVEIVLGDARLSLEKELVAGQKQQFDILVMDVFSSDAIPLHLLTKEAFAIYLAHLTKKGILAVHITNRSIDLRPVLLQLAQSYQLHALQIEAKPDWVLLGRNMDFLPAGIYSHQAHWLNKNNTKSIPLWTDDYSNLLQIVKWHESNSSS